MQQQLQLPTPFTHYMHPFADPSTLLLQAPGSSQKVIIPPSNPPLLVSAISRPPTCPLGQYRAVARSSKLFLSRLRSASMISRCPRLKPVDRLASYYNPKVQVKVKDGVLLRRTHTPMEATTSAIPLHTKQCSTVMLSSPRVLII